MATTPSSFVPDTKTKMPSSFVPNSAGPKWTPRQVEKIRTLQSQLRGQLPQPDLRRPGMMMTPGASGMVPRLSPDETMRRAAFAQLRKMGFNREDIAAALAYERGMQPRSQLPQAAGATIGSVAALGLGQLGPQAATPEEIVTVPAFAKAGAQIGMAATGGAAGRLLQMYADPDEEFNARELAKAFGEEALLEGATLGAGAIGKRIFAGAKKTLIPGARRISQKLSDAAQAVGIKKPLRLLPAQWSENQLIDTIQGIGENSLIGSNTIYQYRRGQVRAAEFLLEKLPDEIARGASRMSVDDMARLVYDTVEGNDRMFREAAYQLYGALDDALEGTIVDIRPVKELAKGMQERALRAGRIGHTPGSTALLDRVIDDVDDLVSFQTAQDIRSGMLDILRRGESKLTPDPKAVGIVKRLAPAVDNAMEIAMVGQSKDAVQLWRTANRFYKQGKETFNSKLIRGLMRKLPDQPGVVTKAIFLPHGKRNLQIVKKAIGPDQFQKLKGAWIQSLANDAMIRQVDPSAITGAGDVVGTRMLKKFNGLGQEALDFAFTPVEQESIRDVARTLAIVEAKTGGHSGALRFVQGSALMGIVAAPFVPEEYGREKIQITSGIVLIGPAVLGRLMTKPSFARLLSEGVQAKAGTQQAVAAGGRLVKMIMQTRKELNSEQQKKKLEHAWEKHRYLRKSIMSRSIAP